MNDPLRAYLNYAISGETSVVSNGMAGYIPRSLQDSIFLATRNRESNGDYVVPPGLKPVLGKIYERTTRSLRLFTPKARESLDLFYNDALSIEVAHQPKFLGGERFILNKIALGGALASQSGLESRDARFYPFFYLADYDKVHPELVKCHFSLVNSSGGFTASIDPDVERLHEGTGIRNLPLPSDEHLLEILSSIQSNYKFSIKSCVENGYQRGLLEERLESALRLIKKSYYLSSTYNEWFLNIIGTVANIIYDHGYLFLVSSDNEYRELIGPVYENLIKNRPGYVAIYNDLRHVFSKNGFRPPLREINTGFVPFFYECTEKSCDNQRILLEAEETVSRIIMQGKCERCGTIHEIITSKESPDLSDHYLQLTPRVESRQYVVNKSSAPAIHVSGTGETRYYTMSVPLMKAFDNSVFLPVIHFYNKITTNTFITRHLESAIISFDTNGFLENIKSLMKLIGRFNKLVRTTHPGKDVEEQRARVLEILVGMKESMNAIEQTCKSVNADSTATDEINSIQNYLANTFGMISRERHGQEAVFHWLDLCLKNGLARILDDYQKIYQAWLPPGLEIFL
ncbi:MAG: hypothetical protein ACTSUE_11060 [Promethearchaeota archaeon]